MESSDGDLFVAVVSAHCGRQRSACALETRVSWLAAADWVGMSSSRINDPQSQVQSLTLITTIAWALAFRQADQHPCFFSVSELPPEETSSPKFRVLSFARSE